MAKPGEQILQAQAHYARMTDDGSPEYRNQVRLLSDEIEKAVYEIVNDKMSRAMSRLH